MKKYYVYRRYPNNPLYAAITEDKPRGVVWRPAEGWVDSPNDRLLEMIYFGEVYLDEITESGLPSDVPAYS